MPDYNRKAAAYWWMMVSLGSIALVFSMWTVAAFTGLRRAELCGLRWADVDLDGKVPGIDVSQRVVAANGPQACPSCGQIHQGRVILEHAKTAAGVRWVPLGPQPVAALRAHREHQAVARPHDDLFTDHDLVWPTSGGEPLRPALVTKRHAALVAGAGLPRIKLHETRHSAISLLAHSGMPLELIAIIAGHASKSLTQSVYLHGIKTKLGKYMTDAETFARQEREQNADSHSPDTAQSSA